MKFIFWRQIFFVMAILVLAAGCGPRSQAGSANETSQTNSPAFSTDITPQAVLNAMQHVADWQLAHANDNQHPPTDWVWGVGDAGMMALVGISGDAKYRDAMLAMGETNDWELGPLFYDADDHCVGQTYAELYFLYRDPKMIAPLRERFDAILANPSEVKTLDYVRLPSGERKNWTWCDSLFMGPPTWIRLYAATGDERYLNFAVTNWWRTADYLCDTNEHLFYRDSTYLDKEEANGQKVFWSRGNGWVMAGLVRMLQYLPMNHPDRPRFEQLFKDMAAKILSLQQPDGLWRPSLLDPDDFPEKESSGSALFTYSLAWGVNQGLLDRAKFEPAVRKGWTALVGCVNADGKLTHVQPIGQDPRNFAADSTEPFGVGAFLLAGSEVYRMAVSTSFAEMISGPLRASQPFLNPSIAIKITNPSSFKRDCETVEINLIQAIVSQWKIKDSQKHIISEYVSTHKFAVMDGVSSRILDSQIYSESGLTNSVPDKLLFQVDLAPHETRTYYILDASVLAAVPPPIVKTFARYVPEREDDFAWESDRIAHRMFGKALETWKQEPLISSGVDVWVKRTRNLIVNQMYGSGEYYNLNGPSQDDYKVGKTRGDGGLGVWQDGKLFVSSNWWSYEIITTGPIRSEFELTYQTWDADGRKVSETKRISIDAGSNMSRVESTFSSDDKSPLQIGVGLAERPGENIIAMDNALLEDAWQNSTAKGLVVQNQDEGWMTYWQPQDFAKGVTAVAIILPKGSIETFTNDLPNLSASKFTAPTHTFTEGQPAIRDLLAITQVEIGKPLVYYLGAGWSESGDFPDAKSWNDYIRRFAERRDQPLQITIGN